MPEEGGMMPKFISVRFTLHQNIFFSLISGTNVTSRCQKIAFSEVESSLDTGKDFTYTALWYKGSLS